MKTTTLTLLILLATTSIFAQIPTTSTTDQYNDLSEEAKVYMKMYTEKTGDLKRKQYLQKLYDDWAKKGISNDAIAQSYTNLVTEIYSKNTDAAFYAITELPFDIRARDVMNKLKPEIQNTIRKKAQAQVNEFEKTRNNNTTTNGIPTATATTQQPQTVQKPEPVANPLAAYVGKVYQLDITNPHGNSTYDKPRFYIFGYEGQNLKGIVQYENGKQRTKTTVTINAPYYYEYANFPEYLIKNKKIVGTCSKNIAICSTCGGNGNSSKTKETKKTTGYNYMNNTVTEVTYRTYYPCGRCSGKGLLPNG